MTGNRPNCFRNDQMRYFIDSDRCSNGSSTVYSSFALRRPSTKSSPAPDATVLLLPVAQPVIACEPSAGAVVIATPSRGRGHPECVRRSKRSDLFSHPISRRRRGQVLAARAWCTYSSVRYTVYGPPAENYMRAGMIGRGGESVKLRQTVFGELSTVSSRSWTIDSRLDRRVSA